MASNAETFAPADVLTAMATMRGGSGDEAKLGALAYLEKFQKSKNSWATIMSILKSPDAPAEVQLFSAITLRGKITYDLATQVPGSQLPALRDELLLLLRQFAPGPKPVRVQLCVCLAVLALQMTDWKGVLTTVVAALANSEQSHASILDFLRVLPEEVNEGRKISLTEEELSQRTTELLSDEAEQVVQLLINYAQSSATAVKNPQLMQCITSWLREVPIASVVGSSLLDAIFKGLEDDASLMEATECLCAIFHETSEVEDNLDSIETLFPRVMQLQPLIAKAASEEDVDTFKSLTKLFAAAADAWVIAIVKQPNHFRPLVDAVLECAARDKDVEAIEHTFSFWYELKQYLVIERYIEARVALVHVYSKLVDIMMKHLEYPEDDTGSDRDLFSGDREQEEKFREFRHKMGDTLKDACEVMGVTECLTKVHETINVWLQKYASQVSGTRVPHWQQLEAPLFALRALGRMVNKDENIVLKQLMPLLVQIPSHEKLLFATIMVLSRYTEWTAANPEFFESQFQYITAAFQSESKEIIRAAAVAIKYFCTDCRELLTSQVLELQKFYDMVLDKLPDVSQEEMTEGVASVVAAQPADDVYRLLKLYCDPLVQRMVDKARNATDERTKLVLADHIQLITAFVMTVKPYGSGENPAVKYWQEVFPVLANVLESFMDFVPVLERICRCWRHMTISYRTAMTPLLEPMAKMLAKGFQYSREGCFLWATGAILREFSEDREHVDPTITDSIYAFFESQATTFLQVMSTLQAKELPDLVEDFFRLLVDALCYYPARLIPSALLTPIVEAAIYSLQLEQRDPLVLTLHFLLDLLSYAGGNPATSFGGLDNEVAAHLRNIVRQLITSHGERLVKQVMAGMMLTFPRDCFADGSSLLLELFRQFPTKTTEWVGSTIRLLPAGTVSPAEAERLMTKIKSRLQGGDAGNVRQVRALLQDFTNTYRRRNVAPRDGLGQLTGERFRFQR